MQTFAISFVVAKLKTFLQYGVCSLNKFVVDLTLTLKAVPSNAHKIHLSSPFSWTTFKVSGTQGLRMQGENLSH